MVKEGSQRRAMSKTFNEIAELFSARIGDEYLGEDVKLVEHMLQCGDLAKSVSAPDYLVVAALLHDIGHLLVEDAVGGHDGGVDKHHDLVGAKWIEERFPATVSEPVRLHVAAKRYLVTTLYMQGGPLNQEEVIEFISREGAEDAVRVRLWDDLAKVRDKPTSTLLDFKTAIDSLARN